MIANQIDRFMNASGTNIAEQSIIFFAEGAAKVILSKAGEVVTSSILKWCFDPRPLSSYDLERYRDLVSVYLDSFGRQNDIPLFWKLSSDNKPTFAFNYSAEITKTQLCIDSLIAKKSGMYLARASILSLLVRYLKSMQNRMIGSIRGDGIELMFVLEMLTWFREVVPELDQKDRGHILQDLNRPPRKLAVDSSCAKTQNAEPGCTLVHEDSNIASTKKIEFKVEFTNRSNKNTESTTEKEDSEQNADLLRTISSIGGIQDILEARINYCKKVSPRIAKYNILDSKRSNFLDLIKRLTEQFESYKMYLIQKSSVIRFNELINTLGDQLSELSALSFHVLYLLINGAHQSYLIVEQFLSPYLSDVKVIEQKNKRIGVWLEKTLQLVGVEDSTFESNKKITFASIQYHLENEIPSDENFNLEGNLRDPLSKDWGHWDFIVNQLADNALVDESKTNKRQELEIQAVNYLQQIRQLSCSISLIYFIRQNMVRAATVASVFGELWIYGDRVGKVVLEELLSSIREVLGDYSDIFQLFWKNYFNNYISYAEKNGTNHKKDKCFEWLKIHVDLKYKPTIEKLMVDIKNQLDSVRAHSETLPQIKKETKKIKKDLYKDLLDFMKFKNKKNSSNYIIIKNALDDLEFEQTKEDLSAQDLSTIITFPLIENRVPELETEPQKKPSSFVLRSKLGIFRNSYTKVPIMENNDKPLVKSVPPLWGNHLHIPGRMHWVQGDGNCFFRAIAFELNRQKDGKWTHENIRDEAIKYLIEYKSLFSHVTCENKTIETYIEEMSLPGTWAEGPIIDAVALCLKVHLCILDVREDTENGLMYFPIHVNENGKNLKCTVGLVRQKLHYNALELPNNSTYINKTLKNKLEITKYQDRDDDITNTINLKKGISETCINFNRNNLSVFESVSIILGASIITNNNLLLKTNSQLVKRPKQFHNDMHKHIYDNFLSKHNRIIKNYLWALSIHYLISESKVNALVSLYKKVNACFVIIYDEKDVYDKISKLEKTMIDERLYRSITKAFSDNNFFQFTLPAPNSALEITKNGDSYDVAIDSYKIPEIKNAILKAADEQLLMRSQDRNKVIELEEKLAASKQEAENSKQEAQKEKQEAEKSKQETEKSKQEAAASKLELSKLKQELVQSKQEAITFKQELDNLNRFLLNQVLEIEAKDNQINELRRQLNADMKSQSNKI